MVKVGGGILLGACVINVHLCRLARSVCGAKNSHFCRRNWKVGFNFDLLIPLVSVCFDANIVIHR